MMSLTEKESRSVGNWQAELNELPRQWESLIIQKFTKCPSDLERIILVQEEEILKNITWVKFALDNCKLTSLKSAEKSRSFRNEGNSYFCKKLYRGALELFEKAILHAPTTDCEELSLAYGNHSATLLYLQKYEECLGDINLALQNGYPSHLRYKLRLREIKCLVKLGKSSEAHAGAAALTEEISSQEDMNKKKKEDMLGDLAKCISELSISTPKNCSCANEWDPSNVPTVSYGESETVVQSSASIKLKYDSDKGRHLLATQDISAGDTLIVERPFAAVLLPDHYHQHCHHCYVSLKSIVPCQRCTRVSYCSQACSKESWDIYHQIECPYLDILHSVGIAHLSLRVILTAGLQYLLEFRDEYERSQKDEKTGESTRIPGISSSGKYERNYLTVYDLMPHSEDMNEVDLFQYTVTAVLLLQILQVSGWFHKKTRSQVSQQHPVPLSDTETYIGSLLLRHIQQLVCNAHAITKLQLHDAVNQSLVESQSQVRVATAIYPTASLMNHSCDPTIISSFHKDTLVVRAIKDVKTGEEIYNCYGPHFKRMCREERQQILREQYFFCCQCQPCLNDCSENFNCYVCPDCSDPLVENTQELYCRKCDKKQRSEDFRHKELKTGELFILALNLLEKQNVQDAIQKLLECFKLRKKILHPYHKLMAETQDCLARCYSITGHFQEAVKFLEPSLETVMVTFGEKSIEYANELQKYAEILVHAGKLEKAYRAACNCLTLFKLHYGLQHESVKELEDLVASILQYTNMS